jgi:pyruvate/oxaloacetate carboxyltransferase
MKTLSTEQALSFGGNLWEKDSMKRVYLNIEAVSKVVQDSGYAALTPSKKMKQAKTYLNVFTGEFISDVGMVRSALCGAGYNCEKA